MCVRGGGRGYMREWQISILPYNYVQVFCVFFVARSLEWMQRRMNFHGSKVLLCISLDAANSHYGVILHIHPLQYEWYTAMLSTHMPTAACIYLFYRLLQGEGTHSRSNSCPHSNCQPGHSEWMCRKSVHCHRMRTSSGIQFGSEKRMPCSSWLPSCTLLLRHAVLTVSRVFPLGDCGLYVSWAYTVSVEPSLWQTKTSSIPFVPITGSADTPTATHPSSAPSNSNSSVSKPFSLHWTYAVQEDLWQPPGKLNVAYITNREGHSWVTNNSN